MKIVKFLSLALIATLGSVFISSCDNSKPVLHVYNWGDYIASSIVEKFEEEFNCKVVVDAFDSNEAMYAKLQAGAGGYDVIVPSSYTAKLMFDQNMIEELDLSKLPNVVKNYDKNYLSLSLDPEHQYSVPYFVSLTGIGYNTKKVPDFKPTWHMFEREDLKGHCTLLNDMRESIGCALVTLGYNVNSVEPAQIDKAVKLLTTWKKNIAKFGVDDAKLDLASGQMDMIQTYSGDMLQVSMENPDIAFVIPEEGSTVTMDVLVVMKDSSNKELAYSFIDFLYRPEISAENMDEIMYVSPNAPAYSLVNEELSKNSAFNLPADAFKRCIPLIDLGEENRKYIKAWDMVRED